MSQDDEIEPRAIIDWDDLSESDQQRAMSLLKELNQIFDKYSPREDEDAEEQ